MLGGSYHRPSYSICGGASELGRGLLLVALEFGVFQMQCHEIFLAAAQTMLASINPHFTATRCPSGVLLAKATCCP